MVLQACDESRSWFVKVPTPRTLDSFASLYLST